jgi:hypothetical protein
MEGIETSLRLVLKKSFPQLPILNKEESRLKFKKDIVVWSNFVNGSKILGRLRNMKDMIKFKVTKRSTNDSMTNMFNMHIWPTYSVDLFSSIVDVHHGQFIQITSDMVCGIGICILVGVDTIGWHSVGTLFFPHICWIKPFVALEDRRIDMSTQLTRKKFVSCTTVTVTTTIVATMCARTSTTSSSEGSPLTTHKIVSRGLGRLQMLLTTVLKIKTILKGKELCIQFTEGDWLNLCSNRWHDSIVFKIKYDQNIWT